MTRVLLIFPALLLLSCSLATSKPQEHVIRSSPAYEAAVSGLTRTGEARQGVDVLARLTATWLTPAFRETLEAEYQHVYGTPMDEPGLQVSNVVFVVALTGTRRELQRPPAYPKLWTLAFLTNEGEEVEPRRVEHFVRDSMFFEYFFPYWTPWRNMYRVEFPVDPAVTSGSLVYRGVAGEIRLDW